MAVIAAVGVFLAGLGATYLSVRPAHAQSSRAGLRVPLSVSCPTARFCMAVDNRGNALRFDDGVWSRPRLLQDTGLNSVSCADPTFCVAVDVNGDAFVFRGATWSAATSIDAKSAGEVDSFGTSGLSTVSCATQNFCMSGDALGRVSSFNGEKWTRARRIEARDLYQTDRHAGGAGISGLSCPQPTFCMAVTVQGRAIMYNGATWSSPSTLEPANVVNLDRYLNVPALAAVSCVGPSFCAAVDPGGNVAIFNGASWSAPRAVDPRSVTSGDGDGLTDISCWATEHCVAVDGRGDALTDGGGVWSRAAMVDSTFGLMNLDCAGPDFCVALNDLGRASTFDGHGWSALQDIDR